MDENSFKRRTKRLALHIIKAVEVYPKNRTADVLGRQLIRPGTSVGANYRAACRGKSTGEEEADESFYTMELLIESDLVSADRMAEHYAKPTRLSPCPSHQLGLFKNATEVLR